jgi:hypothetical protein
MGEPSWADTIAMLRRLGARWPAGEAEADLLASTQTRWQGKAVPWTSHEDVVFTRRGERPLLDDTVRVSYANGVFEFKLLRQGSLLVTADRCRQANASAVLDAFLIQLAGDAE